MSIHDAIERFCIASEDAGGSYYDSSPLGVTCDE